MRNIFSNQLFARREIIFLSTLAAFGIAAVFFMRYLTPNGMGLVNDSVAYIGGARYIQAGEGYSRMGGSGSPLPITHFPPMFSLVLVAAGYLGMETLSAARVVNLLLFGANLILMGLTTRKITGSRLFGMLGVILFIASEPFLRIHSFALSEPLYLFISFLGLWLLAFFIEQNRQTLPENDRDGEAPKTWGWLAGAAVLFSMAFLTRYVGVALYATAGIAILFFLPTWRKRIKSSLVFLAFSLPGPIAWMGRNYWVTGNPTNRPFYWHPLSQDKLFEGLSNFWRWWLPEYGGLVDNYLPYWKIISFILLILLVGGAILFMLKYSRTRKPADSITSAERETENNTLLSNLFLSPSLLTGLLYAIYGILYLALLVFAMTFYDEKTIFEHRILAPFYLSILIIFVCALAWMWRRPQRIFQAAAVILTAAVLVIFMEDSLDTGRELHSAGQGFAAGKWRNSETMEAVRQLPEIKMFTNKQTALYLLAGRPSYVIPWRFEPEAETPTRDYLMGVENYRQQVLQKEAVVVIFDYDLAIADGDERVIDITRDLPIYGMYPDGAIFGDP